MLRHLSRGLVFVTLLAAGAQAEPLPRSLPAGQLPKDERLGELRDLNGYHPFHEVKSVEAWKKRAEELRQQVLVSQGLWPLPEKTPLNAKVHGKVHRGDFTVERVILESYPGHYVTGSLYRPVGRSGKLPAVLCPHGHWPGGRFYDAGPEQVRQQIAIGAERFEVSGRYPLQARCVQLARMGCVVFMFDMEGYADSVQFEHRAGVRESMNTPKAWGYFSPQAELRLQNMMGLQTWNQVRALDFVAGLPDVDTSRIAVTGASGGGTQSMLLAAIDDRIALTVPAVMTSTAMQGGCTCENATYLRIGAGNIDIAGLAAPRPQLCIGADDWTIEFEKKGLPELKQLYDMLGAKGKMEGKVNAHFKHNYNAVSRVLMYNFVNRHFKLGLPEPVLENDFSPLSQAELTVWDEKKHPKPAGEAVGEAHERKLLEQITAMSEKQYAALRPADGSSLEKFRQVIGGGWDVLLGRRQMSDIAEVDYGLVEKTGRSDYLIMTALITMSPTGQQLPTMFVHPKDKARWNGEVVIVVSERGKAGMFDAGGGLRDEAMQLLAAGYSIAGVDMMGTGEFSASGDPVTAQRYAAYGKGRAPQPWQKAACYTYGYNHPLFTQRVHDVMAMVKFVATDKHEAKKIHLLALDPVAGAITAAARSRCGDLVDKTVIDGSFRFASVSALDDPMMVPGAVKYGDTPAILALCAPHPVTVIGEIDATTRAAYQAAGAAGAIKSVRQPEVIRQFVP